MSFGLNFWGKSHINPMLLTRRLTAANTVILLKLHFLLPISFETETSVSLPVRYGLEQNKNLPV
jgi:hypothetical protein